MGAISPEGIRARARGCVAASFAALATLWFACTGPELINSEDALTVEATPSPSASTSPSPAPSLVSVLPTSGVTRGGTTVTLSGTGFLSGLSARFGLSDCSSMSLASASLATCVTPSHVPSTVAVTLANPDGQISVLEAGYRFLTPANLEVRPSGSPSPQATITFSPVYAHVMRADSFELANTGEAQASLISIAGLDSPFSRPTGTPGEGKCDGRLDGARTCLANVILSPLRIASFGQTITISYADDGGSTANATTTARLELSSKGVVAIVVGPAHSCALISSGEVKCWGKGSNGQLGDNNTNDSSVPRAISSITSAIQIVAFNNHSCALLSDRTIRCWGGGANSAVFGDNLTRTNSALVVQPTGISNAAKICAGGVHVCALLSDQTVKCWGRNGTGQLGDNSQTTRGLPVLISGMNDFTDVSCSSNSTCAVHSSGQAYCWGQDNFGDVGDGGPINGDNHARPVPVSGLTDATRVWHGGAFNCASRAGGTAVCWGDDQGSGGGTLGDGLPGANSSSPVVVSGASSVQKMEGAGNSNCLISAGVVRCFGVNAYGHLGDNNAAVAPNAVLYAPSVASLSPEVGDNIVELAVGQEHVCAISQDGRAYCWGENSNGELGTNSTTNYAVPVRIDGKFR